MNFGDALVLLKDGQKVRRFNWGVDKLCLFIVHNFPYNGAEQDVILIDLGNGIRTVWLASNWITAQNDLLADDWMVI